MKKWLKITLWIVGIAVALSGGLILLGYVMHTSAENFVTEKLDAKKVRVVMSSDDVMCRGGGTGLIVGVYDNEKPDYYPVCTYMFADTNVGKWLK